MTAPNAPGDVCATINCRGLAKFTTWAEQTRHGDAAPFRCIDCVSELNAMEEHDDGLAAWPRWAVAACAVLAVAVLVALIYGCVLAAVAVAG